MAKFTEGDYIDQDGAVKLLVYLLNHINLKQDILTFDLTPTDGSHNPVESNGIFDALALKQDALTFDLVPTKNSTNPVESNGIFNALGTKQDKLTFDKVPTDGSTNPVESDGVFDALAGKQDTLTFDTVPTDNSTNPVESNGVFDALALKQDKLTFDKVPTDGSTNPVESNGIFDALALKQDTLTFDEVPTANSPNPVKSGGIHTALSGKQDTLQFDNQPTQYSTNMVNSGNIYTWVLAQLTGYQYVDISISNVAPSEAPANPNSTIYIVLVPNSQTATQNLYSEYIWVTANNAWEKLGAIEVDMSQYIKKTDIDGTTIQFNESDKLCAVIDLSGYLLKTDIDGVTIKMNNAGKLYADIDLSNFLQKTDIDGVSIQLDGAGKLCAVIDLSNYALSSDIGDATLTIKQGTTTLGTFKANAKTDATINIPEPDLSDYALKADIGDATITLKIGETTVGSFTTNAATNKTITLDLSSYAAKTDIGDATLTIKQGNTTLGTFKANASTDKTITIDMSAYAEKTDVGDGVLTLTQGGSTLGTFSANNAANKTIDIPASASAELWNDNDHVAHHKSTEALLPQAITNGKVYFTTDEGNLYLDSGNARIKIGDYITLADENARLNLQNPLEDKLYMVESTHCLWSYKNDWWSLLSFGDLLKRNVLVTTFPVAQGSNSPVEQGGDGNWTAHATMIQVPELIYLTADMKFKACVTQLPSSPGYDLYIAPAIYKYTGPDPDDGDKIKCSLVAAGNAKIITSIGWQEFTFNRSTEQYLDPMETYFYVYLHNMNGLGMPGYSGTQMNDPPYVSWTQHNLGSLYDAPDTLELQSETTTRLYGSFYANGATQ